MEEGPAVSESWWFDPTLASGPLALDCKSGLSMTPPTIRAAVIAALAIARERDGMTQRALAERAGMTEGNLSDWLSGHTNITDATADRVLRVLGLEVKGKR